MPKLIKDGVLIDNIWQQVSLDKEDPLPSGNVLVSMEYWNAHQAEICQRLESVGLLIEPSETPDSIVSEDLNTIAIIAVNFPAFADGRGFSIARLLRGRYSYRGEIRAVGAPIRDQLSYLMRVGFNAVELAEHYDAEQAIASLKDFSDNYQTSVEQPLPLFRRRS